MYAAPFDNNETDLLNNENDGPPRKKNTNNKTQRNVSKQNYSEKVNSVLQTMQAIQNLPEENDELSDFTPPPPPTSVGVLQTQLREQEKPKEYPPNTKINYVSNSDLYLLQNDAVQPNSRINYQIPQNVMEGTADPTKPGSASASASASASPMFNSNYPGNTDVENYYKQFIPNYQSLYKTSPPNLPHYPNYGSTSSSKNDPHSLLLQKLNYMINLLEQHQDEKTQNVTEEIILYCFLGIFLIFIVDSFARVGKYTR